MQTLLDIFIDLDRRFSTSKHHRPIVPNLTSQPLPQLADTLEQNIKDKLQLPLDVWVALHPLGQAAGLELVTVTVADGEYGWPVNGYVAKHGQCYGLDALGSAFGIRASITDQLQAGVGEDWPKLGDLTTAILCLQEAGAVR
jgi:hypothetical protein